MKNIIITETLRESCRWLDDGKCTYISSHRPECNPLHVDEHGEGDKAVLEFMERCILFDDF